MIASKNLTFIEEENLSVSINDSGFLYGYGGFETLLVVNQKPILLKEHLQRLFTCLGALKIMLPFDFSVVESHVEALCEKQDKEQFMLNIYVTGGNREFQSASFSFKNPQIMMLPRPVANEVFTKQFKVGIRSIAYGRNDLDGFKQLAYVKPILERLIEPELDEVILTNPHKQVLEAAHSNVFIIKNKEVFTPNNKQILPGIMRGFLLDQHGGMGFPIKKVPVLMDDVAAADEIFLTNSLVGIGEVATVREFPNLKSGKITRQIKQKLFEKLKIPQLQDGVT